MYLHLVLGIHVYSTIYPGHIIISNRANILVAAQRQADPLIDYIHRKQRLVVKQRNKVQSIILVDGVDPLLVVVNIGVHSRDMGAASDPPSHQANHCPPSGLSLADKRASSVTSASIFPILCPRAHLSLAELEPVSNSRLFLVERSLQGCVALRGGHQWHVDLVEDMIKLLLAGGEAGRGDIGVLQVNNS